MTIVAITGHRPEQLVDEKWVAEALQLVFSKLQPELVYQGMAAGADLLSAEVAHKMGLPYVACKPWSTHTPRNEDIDLYAQVLAHAERVDVVTVSDTYAGPWIYHKRNEYMVNHADIVVAVWSGSTNGGTAACVRYAKKKNKTIVQINPVKKTITYLRPPTPVIVEPVEETLF